MSTTEQLITCLLKYNQTFLHSIHHPIFYKSISKSATLLINQQKSRKAIINKYLNIYISIFVETHSLSLSSNNQNSIPVRKKPQLNITEHSPSSYSYKKNPLIKYHQKIATHCSYIKNNNFTNYFPYTQLNIIKNNHNHSVSLPHLR